MFILGFLLLTSFSVTAQRSEVFIKSGTAIQGYDAVAYFKEGKAVIGNEQFSFKWNDASWNFANQQNLDSFKLNPVRFAPQYGGYCAYGMSEGHKAPTDPNAFTIVNDKLYLNYNPTVNELWNKNQAKRIEDADKNWPVLKSKE